LPQKKPEQRSRKRVVSFGKYERIAEIQVNGQKKAKKSGVTDEGVNLPTFFCLFTCQLR
jgi:hypothetical protein